MGKVLGSLVAAVLLAGCPQPAGPTGSSTGAGSSTRTGSASTSWTEGGSTGTVDPGCGSVSEQGFCNGSVATDCFEGDADDGGTVVVHEDCSQFPPGSSISCGVVSGDYLDFGIACLASQGTPCAFSNEANQVVITPCAGDGGSGCVLTPYGFGSECESGFAPCAFFGDGGLPQPYCSGEVLIDSCVYDQPVGFDCAAFAGTCTDGGQCLGGDGAPCSRPDGSAAPLLACAAGLSCRIAPDGGPFMCQ